MNDTGLDIEVYDENDQRIHLRGAYNAIGRLIVQIDTRAAVLNEAERKGRTLTVTVSESSWATYMVPVPPGFDVENLEEYMYVSDSRGAERFVCTDGAVEARDITIEKDESI